MYAIRSYYDCVVPVPGQSGTFAALSWLCAEILARVWLGATHRVERPEAFETLGLGTLPGAIV